MRKSIAVFLAAAGLAALATPALGQKEVERVYAAGPPASVLVFAIAPDKLVGWTRAFRSDEARFVPERYARLPELGRLTGRGNTANVEVSPRPAWATSAKPTLSPPGTKPSSRTLDRVRRAPSASTMDADRRACRRAARDRSMWKCWNSSARPTSPPTRAGLHPDFWASVRGDARWRAVNAVQTGRVYLSPHLPFGWFDFPPGANRLLGIWWAGRLLYPGAFDLDLRAKVVEFHRRFYHREPTAAQLDLLLAQ